MKHFQDSILLLCMQGFISITSSPERLNIKDSCIYKVRKVALSDNIFGTRSMSNAENRTIQDPEKGNSDY
jgi:hypothetical protein